MVDCEAIISQKLKMRYLNYLHFIFGTGTGTGTGTHDILFYFIWFHLFLFP
jgi:hypothetical protein